MEYYSALKRTELSSHEKTWRNLKRMLLRKEGNVKRLHTLWFQLYDILEKTKVWRQEKDGCQVKRGGKGKSMEHRRILEQWNYSV